MPLNFNNRLKLVFICGGTYVHGFCILHIAHLIANTLYPSFLFCGFHKVEFNFIQMNDYAHMRQSISFNFNQIFLLAINFDRLQILYKSISYRNKYEINVKCVHYNTYDTRCSLLISHQSHQFPPKYSVDSN